LSLIQAAQSSGLYRGDMDENVLAAILWYDKPVPLCGIEPLDCSGSHGLRRSPSWAAMENTHRVRQPGLGISYGHPPDGSAARLAKKRLQTKVGTESVISVNHGAVTILKRKRVSAAAFWRAEPVGASLYQRRAHCPTTKDRAINPGLQQKGADLAARSRSESPIDAIGRAADARPGCSDLRNPYRPFRRRPGASADPSSPASLPPSPRWSPAARPPTPHPAAPSAPPSSGR